MQCKLSPRPPRPPPPLRAGVISKGVGCARADPPAAAQAEHGLAPPPALQTPAAPPASCFCLARAQDSRNTHRKTTAWQEEEELEEKEERGGGWRRGRGGRGGGESRGGTWSHAPFRDWPFARTQDTPPSLDWPRERRRSLLPRFPACASSWASLGSSSPGALSIRVQRWAGK